MRIQSLLTGLTLLLLLTSPASAQDGPYLTVLGIAQDAGFPQIGCYTPRCTLAWENPELRQAATAIALVDRGSNEVLLFEASPDLPEQLYRLQREIAAPLSGIFLTHAHIGHYTGLMYLGREALGADGVQVYAMPRLRQYLTENGPWSQLVNLGNIAIRTLQNGSPVEFTNSSVTPFLVPHRDEYSETVGYRIEGPDRTALFIPDINKWEDWDESIVELVNAVDYALLDATFYADGELGNRDMSQIPHPFVTETMDLFAGAPPEIRSRIWFIHLNQSNPLLDPDSIESRTVMDRGFNIARTGDRLPL